MDLNKCCKASGQVDWRNLFEAVALLGFAFLVGQVTFCGWQHETFGLYARGFWAFPFVIWTALRFGVRGTLLILSMFFVQSTWGVIHSKGSFATDLTDTYLLNFILYNGSLIATGMGLAISLTERNLLFRAMNTSHSQILLFDSDTLRYSHINHGALRSLGYTKKEMMALTPLDSWPEFTELSFRLLSAPLLEHKEQLLHFKTLHKRKNGSLYPVEVDLQLYQQADKRYFIAVLVNISERVKTETRLQTIIETVHAIIWATDEHLDYVFVSTHAKDILGLDADNLIGINLFAVSGLNIIHEEDQEAHRYVYQDLLNNGKPVSGLVHRLKHTDGSWKWMSLSATPIFDSNKQLIQIVGVLQDVHAQKVAKEQLLRTNQELDRRIDEAVQASQAKDLLLLQQSQLAGMGEMIGNIAHQWRQPINSLGLILSDMEDAYVHGECDEEYLHSAVAQSNALIQKMSHTIDDFINFAREDKRLGIICLMRETETCLRLISATLQHHRIGVTLHCQKEVMVWGYANEFSQALMNLLTNAKDAICSNNVTDGNIQIEISENSAFGVLTISDNGGGIATDIMPRIFDPYFTTKQQGVGIGLYISRVAIEKNMNGRLEVKNTDLGAQFTIQLPNTQS